MKRTKLILAFGLLLAAHHAGAVGWIGEFNTTQPNKTVQAGAQFSGNIHMNGPCDVVLTFTKGANVHHWKMNNIGNGMYSGQYPTTGLIGGDLTPGPYTVQASSFNPSKCTPYGNMADTLTVVGATPPPLVAQVSSNMLVITSQGTADPTKQPFPTGKFQYSLPTLKSPGCMVDVRVQGPENVYQNGVTLIPGEMSASGQWSGVKSGNFELRTPGKYTLSMVPSANAPAELRCKGLPIGKAFDVASVFRSTTPGMSQPFNPVTPPNPLVKPDAGRARP